jgi:hypothetical protein
LLFEIPSGWLGDVRGPRRVLVGPLVVGYAVERWGSWNVAFYITAIVSASGAVAWLAINPTLPLVSAGGTRAFRKRTPQSAVR